MTTKINLTKAAAAFETEDSLVGYYDDAAHKLGVAWEETDGEEENADAMHAEVLKARMSDPDAR